MAPAFQPEIFIYCFKIYPILCKFRLRGVCTFGRLNYKSLFTTIKLWRVVFRCKNAPAYFGLYRNSLLKLAPWLNRHGAVTLSRMTLSRMTLSRMTLSRMSLSRMTLSRMTLSWKMVLFLMRTVGALRLCRYAGCCYAECCYAECRYAGCCYAECRGTKWSFTFLIWTWWWGENRKIS